MNNWNGTSKSEKYFMAKTGSSEPSPGLIKTVSQFRRDAMNSEAEASLLKNGKISGQPNVLGFTKSASFSYKGTGDTVRQVPGIYSPLWLDSNISLPRDRATINAWCRSFYALNPYVQNAINLHSTYPISKLNIKCQNKEIENFFNDMIEEIDLMNVCIQIAQEFWLLGEAFVYAEMDESVGKWGRLLIQNPDHMIIQPTISIDDPIIMMKPDEHLKKIVFSNKASDVEQRKKLPPHIIDAVRKGQNIQLSNLNVHHLARKISPYDQRGTGLPVCVFRQLMLIDQLRESKFVQANDMINPTTIVKIGSAGEYKTNYADLEHWRDVFAQGQGDKNFKIFTHEGVSVERVGWGSGIYDISGDITQLIKELHVGLQIPSVITEGGGDITYANGAVSLDVLRQRYTSFRNMMSIWLKRKIFAPISKINDFYQYEGGEKKLIVPEIDWNHMSLFDAGDYIQKLSELSSGKAEDGSKRVSVSTLYRSIGLEYEDEMRKIRKESIQQAIFLKEKVSLEQMNLNALRSLKEDDEIPEPKEDVPGQQSPGAEGTNPPDMNLPGLDMNAPPPSPTEAPGPSPGPMP